MIRYGVPLPIPTTSRTSQENQLPLRKRMYHKPPWVLRVLVVLLVGIIAFCWIGLSPRALICFDRTGLDLGDPGYGLPIDYAETLFRCLGPIGWIVGLGAFGLAFTMTLMIYRWPWPLRVIVATAPSALVVYQIIYVSDIHPWVRPIILHICTAEVILAVLAAVLCRRIATKFARSDSSNAFQL